MVSKIVLETPPTRDVNLKWDQPDSTFKLVNVDLPALKDGEVRVKILTLSNDPTQRVWISANQNPARQYMPPILKGDPIRSFGLGEVIESKSEKYSKGDVVTGLFSWAEEVIVPDASLSAKADPSVPQEWYLSVLGLTGLTAYFGLKSVGQLKEGQTILISAASGATGSMAVQLAKHLFKASKVIGLAGSEEKCRWVESLGADACVNYKDADYKEQLEQHIDDDGVDVYFDNVGGEILSFALTHVKKFGRVIACGAVASYNDRSKGAVTTWAEIVINRLTVQGFILTDFLKDAPSAIQDIVAVIKSGAIKTSEGVHVEDVSKDSKPLQSVPGVWHKLFTDEKPKGKLLTKIA